MFPRTVRFSASKVRPTPEGTPPNVVETDPVTFVRLATGRLAWAEAVAGGAVQASGIRADLAPYLPCWP